MDRDKIGAMRLGHILTFGRQTLLQIRFNASTFVAIQTEGLLMAIRAIVPRLLGQQPMFFHKEITMIGYYANAAVTNRAVTNCYILEFSVVGPGKGETDGHEK
jgi:hypothetical protein